MAKFISIGNHKGGVGKTVTAIHVASGLVRIKKEDGKKYKCLLIDIDPQANSTSTLFPFEDKDYKKTKNIIDLFNGTNIDECIVSTKTSGLDLLPSFIDLIEIEMKIASSAYGVSGLKSAIKNSEINSDYDFIIIDTPPNLGCLMINSFVASDYYIVPIESESKYSLDGLTSLNKRINEITTVANSNLKLLGYLITKHDGRNSTCKAMDLIINDRFKDQVFKTKIRKNTDINKALTKRKTIYQHDRRVNAYSDYTNLCVEILERLV